MKWTIISFLALFLIGISYIVSLNSNLSRSDNKVQHLIGLVISCQTLINDANADITYTNSQIDQAKDSYGMPGYSNFALIESIPDGKTVDESLCTDYSMGLY